MEESTSRWYVVQTHRHREAIAARAVRQAGLQVLLPMARKPRPGHNHFSTRPLFPCYLFVLFCPMLELDQVRYAIGVNRVLGSRSIPTPVDQETIDAIVESVTPDGSIHLQPRPVCPGDVVSVGEGPFRGLLGRVKRELNDGRRVLLLLDAIRQTHVIIEKRLLSATVDVERPRNGVE